MKRHCLIIVMMSFILSCAHGRTEHFPSGEPEMKTAEVTVIRNDKMFGFGFSLKVVLDDSVIALLRSGDYVTFPVAVGSHRVGTMEESIDKYFEEGKRYFFMISADYSRFGFEIEEITSKQAAPFIEKSSPIE